MQRGRNTHLIGGGIGSLAAAAFMVRDGGVPGETLTIYDSLDVVGGSLDGAGDPDDGYALRGGRMLTTDHFECTWDLFRSIPSRTDPRQSVYEETIAFNERVRSHARARLVDGNGSIVDLGSLGFSMRDRLELLRLVEASEKSLGSSRISDWLSDEFMRGTFWRLWQTTFAFQPWHSAAECWRYLHRFMNEFSRLQTLGGIKRTVYNQYDALVLPLKTWLASAGVRFRTGCTVSRLDLETRDGLLRVSGFHLEHAGRTEQVPVREGDLVIVQNGSMTDASSVGSMTEAPKALTKADSAGWRLWEQLAEGRPTFGRPAVFNSRIAETNWSSFTVTQRDTGFFEHMEAFTGNEAGTGGLVTFRDSRWLLSIVLPHQPYFSSQPADDRVFWGYALDGDRVGDFVAKPMTACSGEEILRELCGHLRLDMEATFGAARCIPCRMPYITSQFMPRKPGDRPRPIPEGTRDLALVSQFVEIPDDVVFTVEYSVRAAQIAAYGLLGIDRGVPPVHRYDRSLRVAIDALVQAFR